MKARKSMKLSTVLAFAALLVTQVVGCIPAPDPLLTAGLILSGALDY